MPHRWYVVHAYSGFENKVASSIREQAQKKGLSEEISEVIVPTAPERIIFARAEEGEVVVHAIDGRYHTRWSLGELERKLASFGFIRPHRSYLVNSNHVREVIPWFNRSYNLIMDDTDKTRIPVSRHQLQELKKHFDL